MDLLAGRKADGTRAGDILVKGAQTPSSDSSRGRGGGAGRESVYVTQEDFHVAELTVRETLEFAVRLGMGGSGVR